MSRENFIDEAGFWVEGGDGGKGCLSFQREKYRPKGRPNGGDGGPGGNVFCQAEAGLTTLADLSRRRRLTAGRGGQGQGSDRRGKSGQHLVIKVPPGTTVKDEEGQLLADLVEPGERVLVAKGGTGGRGNASLASSAHPWPNYAELGEAGEKRKLRLELKLLADVGIVGLPNAGKSTLLGQISAATPEVAAYPFTTKVPHLGVVYLLGDEELGVVVADVPGLIEGAHRGAGLGLSFLRHLERTRVLLILVDLADEHVTPSEAFESLSRELVSYDPSFLKDRGLLVAGNKADLPAAQRALSQVVKYFETKKQPFYPISALTGQGIPDLLKALSETVATARQRPAIKEESRVFTIPDEQRLAILPQADGAFLVKGPKAEQLVAKTDFENEEAVAELQRRLERLGVERLLARAGAAKGDIVRIGDHEFDFYPPES